MWGERGPKRCGSKGARHKVRKHTVEEFKVSRNSTGGKVGKDFETDCGDLRELVLPGGGDLCLPVWVGMRRMVLALVGWYKNRSTGTPACKFDVRIIDEFLEKKYHYHQHAWKMLDGKAEIKMRAELWLVMDDIAFEQVRSHFGSSP